MVKKKPNKKSVTPSSLQEDHTIRDITPDELEQMDPKTRGKALKRLGIVQEQDRADNDAMIRYRPHAGE